MTEQKKSKNPFINMANEAKAKQQLPQKSGFKPPSPKPSKGFGSSTVVRRSGRGG